jgi:hypothetical protein
MNQQTITPESILRFLADRAGITSLARVIEEFEGNWETAARVEFMLLTLLENGLVHEPEDFNWFQITAAGRRRAFAPRQAALFT